jgi:DNA-directed RNA polymerase beta' subunit
MLNYIQKRELKANQRRLLIDSINIQLASPLQIQSWAQRRLPTGAVVGQVTNSKTLDYKNHKPLKDGLFCERIFGPVRDFVCACGKHQPKDGTKYCLQCGVEFTHSRVRRLRLGYIQLASSVTHIWFLKGRPSYLSLLLGKKKKLVVAIAYCNAFFVEQDFPVIQYAVNKSKENSKRVFPFPRLRKISRTSKVIDLKNREYVHQINSFSVSCKASEDNSKISTPGERSAITILPISQTHSYGVEINDSARVEMNVLDSLTVKQTERSSNDLKGGVPYLPGQFKKAPFSTFYSQAQSLPFLPSLATTYLIRTALINYLIPLPKKEDIGLNYYCQKTRWQPLLDIHDFMAEQPLLSLAKVNQRTQNPLNGRSRLSFHERREGDPLLRKKTQSIEYFQERITSSSSSQSCEDIEERGFNPNQKAFRRSIGPPTAELSSFHRHIKVESNQKENFLTSVMKSSGEHSANPSTLTKNKDFATPFIDPLSSEETLSHTDKAVIKEILSYTGGGALETLLKRFDMALLTSFMSSDLRDIYTSLRRLLKNPKQMRPQAKLTKLLKRLLRRRSKIARRFKLAKLFSQTKRKPEWMMLSVLPVLPPKLRPIERRDGLSYTSDLNRLYQMVLNRNRRFQKLLVVDISTVTTTQRLLQDAVDGLLENGKGGSKPFSHPNGHPLVSLSDKLKGKKGRFRLNLLGKRVDYSGRSVIVVEPKLKLHECGLPEEMALELFRFFLIRQLVVKGEASNIIMAKRLLKQRLPLIWNTLRELISHHPILLNRAPTLHRLGIQAFQPQLIDGNAIKLHPLVCSSFNADFDGDQMAVHVPLSFHARAEAWNLLWSRNNLLSPATGQPILVPSQDMVLGWYYVTTMKPLKNLENRKTQSFLKKGFGERSARYLRKSHRKQDSSTSTLAGIDVSRDNLLPSSCLLDKDFAWNMKDVNSNFTKASLVHTDHKSFKGYFTDLVAVLRAYHRQDLDLHSPIWVRFEGFLECNNEPEKPLEIRIDGLGNTLQLYMRYQRQLMISNSQPILFVRTTPGRVLVNNIVHSRTS